MIKTRSMGMPGMVLGAGCFAIWIADMTARLAAYCDENDIELPFPDRLREFPVTLAMAMVDKCNPLMPDGMAIALHIHGIEVAPPHHKHFDRHGSQIPCETYHYLHDRNDYGLVGHWQNDSGNTHVNTLWIGDEGCIFETRVFSTDPRLNGYTVAYASEPDAVSGHAAMVNIVQSMPTE